MRRPHTRGRTLCELASAPWQGVCDPAAVTTWALSNAASISGSLLTTEALVIERKLVDDSDFEYTPEFTTDINQEAAARSAW